MDGKFLQSMPLFKGIPAEQFPALLSRLHAAERHFAAGSYVLRAGDAPRFGLLLSGRVHVVQEDFWGHQSIMAQLSPGALFGESFALGSGQSLPVSVIAQSSVHALFLDPSLLWHADRPGLAPYPQVTGNLVRILAEKNRLLTQKITHVTQRTLRMKLLSYLSEQAHYAASADFTISFNRQQLADYLSVDRSALSAELGRMQKEGLLSFQKNHFSLHMQAHT